jgi:hypothetical protein
VLHIEHTAEPRDCELSFRAAAFIWRLADSGHLPTDGARSTVMWSLDRPAWLGKSEWERLVDGFLADESSHRQRDAGSRRDALHALRSAAWRLLGPLASEDLTDGEHLTALPPRRIARRRLLATVRKAA